MTVIYLDRVFLLNVLTDYLLLLTTSRIAGIPLMRRRLIICALLGGAYAVTVLLPGFSMLSHPVCKIAVGLSMAALAYRNQRGRVRLMALFLLLSAALGGALLALALLSGSPESFTANIYRARINWPLFLISTGIIFLLVQLLFRQGLRHGRGEIMEITVTIDGKKQAIHALYDTGNTLCDPVSGHAVLVLEQQTLYGLWPPEVTDILRQPLAPEEKMAQLHLIRRGKDFSLLPFRSVGVPSGLMLAYRSEAITVKGRDHRKTLLGLSEGPLSDGGAYHALWGGEEGGAYGKDPATCANISQEMDPAV